jgi:hypothetical protein
VLRRRGEVEEEVVLGGDVDERERLHRGPAVGAETLDRRGWELGRETLG